MGTGGLGYCGGHKFEGQLGDGDATATSSTTPVAVAGRTRLRLVQCRGSHACGITVGGESYCWSWNGYGQIGRGFFEDR